MISKLEVSFESLKFKQVLLLVVVNTVVYQETLEHFINPSANNLYSDVNFLSQHHLGPVHSDKTTTKWFAGNVFTLLHLPANSLDPNSHRKKSTK